MRVISLILVFLLISCQTTNQKEQNRALNKEEAYTVNTKNASFYETWQLCTLLYRPTQIYENWYVEEGENKIIITELEKRGVITRKDCDPIEIAKRKCLKYGFLAKSENYSACIYRKETSMPSKIKDFKFNESVKALKRKCQNDRNYIANWRPSKLSDILRPVDRQASYANTNKRCDEELRNLMLQKAGSFY